MTAATALLPFLVLFGLVAMTRAGETNATSVLDFKVRAMDGRDVPLSDYRGKVLLIVNVASRCGFTKQYAGLQKLFETYGDKGLVVLGFPANNFLGQEPGTDEEIRTFCTATFGVTFPVFSKISVKGDDIHPLYRFLVDPATNPMHGGEISWNFNKFLVDRAGRVVNRFGSRTAPDADELIHAVEAALAQTP